MNRFEEAMSKDSEMINAGVEFHKSALKLATEIATKGAAGQNLTDAEQAFMKATALFSITMLMGRGATP